MVSAEQSRLKRKWHSGPRRKNIITVARTDKPLLWTEHEDTYSMISMSLASLQSARSLAALINERACETERAHSSFDLFSTPTLHRNPGPRFENLLLSFQSLSTRTLFSLNARSSSMFLFARPCSLWTSLFLTWSYSSLFSSCFLPSPSFLLLLSQYWVKLFRDLIITSYFFRIVYSRIAYSSNARLSFIVVTFRIEAVNTKQEHDINHLQSFITRVSGKKQLSEDGIRADAVCFVYDTNMKTK